MIADRGPQAKKSRKPLEFEKGKETDSAANPHEEQNSVDTLISVLLRPISDF